MSSFDLQDVRISTMSHTAHTGRARHGRTGHRHAGFRAHACGLHLLIFAGMGPGAGYAAAAIGGHPAGVHAAPGKNCLECLASKRRRGWM